MDTREFEGTLREMHPRAEALAVLAVEALPDGSWRVEAEWADTCEYIRRGFIFERGDPDGLTPAPFVVRELGRVR